LAAIIGGAMMMVGAFLPWLKSGLGPGSMTGWDAYTMASGSERFFILNAFASDFSPMFTGMSVLIAGAVMALIGLYRFFRVRRALPPPPAAAKVAGALLLLAVIVIGLANLLSVFSFGPGRGLLDPDYGLYLVTGGAIIGSLGVVIGDGLRARE